MCPSSSAKKYSPVLRKLGQGRGDAGPAPSYGRPSSRESAHEEDALAPAAVSEVGILMPISHPNIVSLLQAIETEKNIYLIMEMAEGEQLSRHVCEAGRLQEKEPEDYFTKS